MKYARLHLFGEHRRLTDGNSLLIFTRQMLWFGGVGRDKSHPTNSIKDGTIFKGFIS